MEALQLLLNRSSQPKLTAPAPAEEALENIKQAALRAPDHGNLKPWRFIVCEGKGLKRLGEIFEGAAIAEGRDEAMIQKAPQLPMRAPMVIVAIAHYTEHPKVPPIEQVSSTACAVHAMQMAAVAQGFQGIWRTGFLAESSFVKEALSCKDEDEIVGFLYLGTSTLKPMPKPPIDSAHYFTHWDA
ncbi:MAG: NAD(P)H nitroreductase [Glaciecola sp.]